MAGGTARDLPPARGPQPVTWVAMLNRTAHITGAVVVGTALVVTFTVVLGDVGSRYQVGLWILLTAQALLTIELVAFARRQTSRVDTAVALILSSFAVVAACSLGWAALPVSQEAVRLLPIQALHAQLVIAAILLRRRTLAVGIMAVSVLGTIWLTSLSDSASTSIGFDACVLPLGYAVTAMVLIHGLRNAAWQANRLADRLREVRANVVASSRAQLANDEGRRIIHDRVISALSFAEAGRDPGVVAEASRRALDDLAALTPTTTASALREALLAKESPRVIVGGDGWPMSPPALVVTALRESAGEAIRNAEKHAGVDEVTVQFTSTPSGQAAVVVHDAGRGFEPDRTRGFGLSESIVARMGQVGGEARIESAPGMGTTVRLLWPIESSMTASSGSGVLAADGRSRLYVWVTAPLGAAVVYAAARQLATAQAPLASLFLAVSTAVALACWGFYVGRVRPTWPVVIALMIINSLVTMAGLLIAPPGTVMSLSAWPVTATSLAIGGLALAGRPAQVVVAVVAEVATVAGFAAYLPGLGIFEPVGSLLLPIAYAAAGFAVGALLRRGSTMVAIREALENAEMEEEGWVESSAAARLHYAEQLQANVGPFLVYLAVDRPKPSPAVQTRAASMAAECRDLLALSEPMPVTVRDAVLKARNLGVRVAIRDAPSVSPVAWLMLLATLEHAVDADAVTLIPARPNSPARVTVIPRVSAHTEALIRDQLDGQTVWNEHTDVTTSFILVSPEWGASDG